tara:strand:- start:84 stop:890 length:807 start_codon:yes stop_codon:yes gene_type:complete
MTQVCFITAIYGNYESSCKSFVEQTVKTDFICFTDNKDIISNGWTIDTTPYHSTNQSSLDDGTFVNSLCNNKHSFNIAKYYKQAFCNIPRLQKYDVIVWLDGTIEIIYDKTSEYLLNKINKEKIIGWNHEVRYGMLGDEVKVSSCIDRYNSTFWNNQPQPIQDVESQYKFYLEDGYTDNYFKDLNSHTVHMGVWITCFVAFSWKDEEVKKFLDLWYLQTLKYSTQDQVSFSYVCQKLNLVPLTLPYQEIHGNNPHYDTMFYKKHGHGM